jgi:tripartite ATP-independent transporter DctM subunit
MSEIAIGMTFLSVLITLILMRVPLGVALIGVSFCGIWTLMGWRVAWGSLGIVPYRFASSWLLSSIPAFLFMGFICYHTRLTQGLFDAARVWLSRLPGGLAVASVCGCAGFAAVTGSSVACSAAMGKIAIPEMMRHRYSPELATGTVAAAGTIGALIPPSILMILYGVIAQVPIGQLFVGGFAVGLITMLAYILLIVVRVSRNPDLAPRLETEVTMAERLRALGAIWPVVLIFLGVFVGLFSGAFTPTEAGSVGAFLSTVIALLKGTLSWDAIRKATVETFVTTSALVIIGIGASLLTRFLALSGSGEALTQAVLAFGAEPIFIIIGICAIYLVLGLFLEPLGAMLLTLPIVLPVVVDAGFNLIWFGILLTKLLEIGMITPPIGMNVFVIKGVVGDAIPLSRIIRGVSWFIAVDCVLVAGLIVYHFV